jgi:hypothetical protein
VTATLRTLKLLYTGATPDWFFLLSGVDYPVSPAGKVLDELSASGVDALLDYREVPNIGDQETSPEAENPAVQHFGSASRGDVAFRLYVGLNIWCPIIRQGPRIGRKTFYLRTRDWRTPFGAEFRCYFGDHWFAANSKAAAVLLHPTETHLRLQRHLRLRSSPDECYYHTVLANTPGLKISKETKRFAIWQAGHPKKALTAEDLPAIIQSNAYFARKFSQDTPVLDEIDRMLDPACRRGQPAIAHWMKAQR